MPKVSRPKSKSAARRSPKARLEGAGKAAGEKLIKPAQLESAVRKITKPLRSRVKSAEETERELRRLQREVEEWQSKTDEAERARHELWSSTFSLVNNLFTYIEQYGIGRPRGGPMAKEHKQLCDSIELIRRRGMWNPVNAQAAAALSYRVDDEG